MTTVTQRNKALNLNLDKLSGITSDSEDDQNDSHPSPLDRKSS